MKYVTYISNTYATKNRLEADVLEFLKGEDRCVLEVDQLPGYEKHLTEQINRQNAKYFRCQPIAIHFDRSLSGNLLSATGKDLVMRWEGSKGFNGHNLCNFQILAIRDDGEEFV